MSDEAIFAMMEKVKAKYVAEQMDAYLRSPKHLRAVEQGEQQDRLLAKQLEAIGMDAWTPKNTEELIELAYRLGIDPEPLTAKQVLQEVVKAARELAATITPVVETEAEPVKDAKPKEQTDPIFQLLGDSFKVEFGDESGFIKKSVAVVYLHRIIKANGKPLSVADLRGDTADRIKADMAIRDDKRYDGKTLADIRRRMVEIDELIEETGGNDRLEAEKYQLLECLGDDRRIIESTASKAAETIKKQLRDLWKKLESTGLKSASQHFEMSIKWDGFFVSYKPARPTSWKT